MKDLIKKIYTNKKLLSCYISIKKKKNLNNRKLIKKISFIFLLLLKQWTKDDFGLGTHRNLSGFDRYSMVGSDEEGDFSLDIYPVMLDDDAKYQCQVGPGPNGKYFFFLL